MLSKNLVICILLAVSAATSTVAGEVVLVGSFEGRSDHVTTGGVSILMTDKKTIVILESNFSLDGAPDPVVGLGVDGKFEVKSVAGKLKSKEGAQAFELPPSISSSDYNEVYIWCQKFNVPLGVAKLR